MTPYPTLSSVVVEETVFPPSVMPPAADKHFFLAGAGVRGLTVEAKFISFTAIGVYLEDDAVAVLSDKWKGKSADELAESVDFFRDIVTGSFEKFTQVTMLKPLTGAQYSEKVTENCIAIWKALGIYTVAEEKATTKFTEVFKDQTFPPGHSILFKQSPAGSLTIAFGKHDSIPDEGVAVIENKNMAQAVLESIIGKHGVSPDAKRNLAERICALLNAERKPNDVWHTSPSISKVIVENMVFPPFVKPPVADKPFFLGGAGVRGLMIEGKFISFTAIGVYLDEKAVSTLSSKWKGKTADELVDSVEFFRDLVTGPFEKFTQVTMLKPLTGAQYSEKVTENCITIWKALGIYTAAEERATQKFTEVFKDQSFPPGHSILFKQTPDGSLTIAFGKHDSIPEEGVAVIENKNMAEAVLESIVGKHGVSPDAKKNLAERISALLK